jgi:hypothetical protein
MQNETKEVRGATNLFTDFLYFSLTVVAETCFLRLKQHVTQGLVKRMNGSSLAALCCIFTVYSRWEKQKNLVTDIHYGNQESLFLAFNAQMNKNLQSTDSLKIKGNPHHIRVQRVIWHLIENTMTSILQSN